MQKNKGITLVELLISIVFLSLVLILTTSMLTFSNMAFEKGTTQSEVQSGSRYVMNYIENEVTLAIDLDLLYDVPEDKDYNIRYIYVKEDKLIHYLNGEKRVIRSLDEGSKISFTLQDNLLSVFYKEVHNEHSQELVQMIQLSNMPSGSVQKTATSEEAIFLGVSYRIPSSTSQLLQYNFLEVNNEEIDEDIITYVSSDIIRVFVPRNVADLEKLVPSYVPADIKIKEIGDPAFSVDTLTRTIKIQGQEYQVIVERMPETPPQIIRQRIVSEARGIAWLDEGIRPDFIYLSNGNGNCESLGTIKWFVRKNEKEEWVEKTDIFHQNNKIKSSYANYQLMFSITPKAAKNVKGQTVYSDPVTIRDGSLFWRTIVRDIYYDQLTLEDKEQYQRDFPNFFENGNYIFLIGYRDKGLSWGQARNNQRTTELVPELDNELSLIMRGIGYADSSLITIDMARFLGTNSPNSYSLEVQVDLDPLGPSNRGKYENVDIHPSSGWAIVLNGSRERSVTGGNDKPDYFKDTGYAFQFDPGVKGFIIEEYKDGKRPKKWGRFNPADLNNANFTFTNFTDNYTTRIFIEESNNKQHIGFYLINEAGYKSNTLWFDPLPKHNDSNTIMGFRSWRFNPHGNPQAFETKFNRIEIKEGFSMNLIDVRKSICEKELILVFDENVIWGTAQQVKVNDQNYDIKKIIGNLVYLDIRGKQLSNPVSLELPRGSIRHSRAGDVKIVLKESYDINNEMAGSGYYRIAVWPENSANTLTNSCLDFYVNPGNAGIWGNHNNKNQQWRFIPTGEVDTFLIKSGHKIGGKDHYLTAVGVGSIKVSEKNNKQNQKWIVNFQEGTIESAEYNQFLFRENNANDILVELKSHQNSNLTKWNIRLP